MLKNIENKKTLLSSLLRVEHLLPSSGANNPCGWYIAYIIKSVYAWRCSMINVLDMHFDSCTNRTWLALKCSCCSGTSGVIKGYSWLIAQFLESLIIAAQSGKFIIKHTIYSSTFGWSKLKQLDFFWLSIWSHLQSAQVYTSRRWATKTSMFQMCLSLCCHSLAEVIMLIHLKWISFLSLVCCCFVYSFASLGA